MSSSSGTWSLVATIAKHSAREAVCLYVEPFVSLGRAIRTACARSWASFAATSLRLRARLGSRLHTLHESALGEVQEYRLEATKMASVLIAVGDDLVRLALRRLIDAEWDLAVVGEVAEGLAALAEVERLHPDVIILDLMMPGAKGGEIIREVRNRAPETRIVALSMYADGGCAMEALISGASVWVQQDAEEEGAAARGAVVDAVRTALGRDQSLSPPSSRGTVNVYRTLTRCEREVLQLVAQGRTTGEIAKLLSMTERMVETNRAKAFQKVGLRNQDDLVRFGQRRGIIRSDKKGA